jgi:hypothetical protein
MRKLLLTGMIALVVIGGCGRKELPQPDTSEPLRIVDLKAEKAINILKLSFSIQGGYGPVGYQIDRAEVDPICNCLTEWRRLFEQPALPHQKDTLLVHNLNLLSPDREFAFRIRAVDSAGNLSTWSKPMRARADAMP